MPRRPDPHLRTFAWASFGLPLMLLSLLVLSGCANLGGILGDDDSGDEWRGDVRGEVVEVDPRSRTITLDTDADSANLETRDERRTLHYDGDTEVLYRGEIYEPENLERGDLVSVRIERERGRDLAERITVLQDVRAGDDRWGDPDGGWGDDREDRYDNELRGEVADVDASDREIEVELSGRAGTAVVTWDERTVVLFEGREYTPLNLERGDEIHVEGTRRGERLLADRITVEQDVRAKRDSDRYDSDRDGEVRGTVTSIDTRARVVELDLPYSQRGDARILYDERTVVELDGRTLRPESLRRGDEIAVVGTRRDGGLLADSIVVLKEARNTSSQ